MSKSRSPGYIRGDYWVICDVSGQAMRLSQSRKTWDGRLVHRDWWEPRQPQDFVRGVKDDTRPHGPTRPEPPDTFLSKGELCSPSGVAGLAKAGCAIAGNTYIPESKVVGVPEGTF